MATGTEVIYFGQCDLGIWFCRTGEETFEAFREFVFMVLWVEYEANSIEEKCIGDWPPSATDQAISREFRPTNLRQKDCVVWADDGVCSLPNGRPLFRLFSIFVCDEVEDLDEKLGRKVGGARRNGRAGPLRSSFLSHISSLKENCVLGPSADFLLFENELIGG